MISIFSFLPINIHNIKNTPPELTQSHIIIFNTVNISNTQQLPQSIFFHYISFFFVCFNFLYNCLPTRYNYNRMWDGLWCVFLDIWHICHTQDRVETDNKTAHRGVARRFKYNWCNNSSFLCIYYYFIVIY